MGETSMGTISYLPTVKTLRQDFNDAAKYLMSIDPVELVGRTEDQKEDFLENLRKTFFYKVTESNPNHDLFNNAFMLNMRVMLYQAKNIADHGYDQSVVAKIWCDEMNYYINPLLEIATQRKKIRPLQANRYDV